MNIINTIFLATMAIKCWDCNSMINRGCDDPFKPDDFAMADCSQKHLSRFPDKEGNICRKTLQKSMFSIFLIIYFNLTFSKSNSKTIK